MLRITAKDEAQLALIKDMEEMVHLQVTYYPLTLTPNMFYNEKEIFVFDFCFLGLNVFSWTSGGG